MRSVAAVSLVLLLAACGMGGPDQSSPPSTNTSTVVVTPSTGTVPPGPVADGPYLQSHVWTPGATNPEVTEANIESTICKPGWTATVRPPASYTEAVKRAEDGNGGNVSYRGVIWVVHGFALDVPLKSAELDHLVPLEAGGAPADPANLWIEPYETPRGRAPVGRGSETKDKVESAARQAICSGRITLTDAQTHFETDWVQLGRILGVVR